MRKLPVGISDFAKIINDNYYYIDKTLLIKEFLDISADATLLPRPRRFGKTLNISMLRYFFEKTPQSNAHLFHQLAIWRQEEKYRLHQGRYPVIFLTFKDISFSNWDHCYNHLQAVIAEEYRRHHYLLQSDVMDDIQKSTYTGIMSIRAGLVDYDNSLSNLCRYLADYHSCKVMIFIDEYDTPVQQGYLNGYYNSIIEFMRVLLGGAFKDNSYLEKGIMTGALRISKESIFTGFNNFEVYSILKNEFSSHFGFLKEEVKDILTCYGKGEQMEEISSWYNGYMIGDNEVFNPWSVLKYLREHQYGLIPHWLNTSSNSLVKQIITGGSRLFKKDIDQLLRGEPIVKAVDENIVFADLEGNQEAAWSLLLFTGYLKATEKTVKEGIWYCVLDLPNVEVGFFYRRTVADWFRSSMSGEKLQEMLRGLISGEVEVFEFYFRQFVEHTMSYFDPVGDEPERVYQAFVMGMFVSLSDDFYVKSNRESGLGRYDLAIIPRDIKKHQQGVVIEFKKVNSVTGETLAEALEAAKKQIETKKYTTELSDAGIKNEHILKIAVAFQGKELLIEHSKTS